MKRVLAALLVICFMIHPYLVFALEGEETPALSCGCEHTAIVPTLTTQWGEDGVYGTLCHLPDDVTRIEARHCFTLASANDTNAAKVSGYKREWNLTPQEDGSIALTQLCIGKEDFAMDAFLNKRVNNLYIALSIVCGEGNIYPNVVHFSNGLMGEAPEIPPNFSAEIVLNPNGYYLMGTVAEILPTTAMVRPFYSLKDKQYEPIASDNSRDWDLSWLGTLDESELENLQTQTCCLLNAEPLKSYMDGDLEEFYLKLEITLDNGITYFTQTAHVTRGEAQELPEGSTVIALYDGAMRVKDNRFSPSYGRYHMTVSEDMTLDEIYDLLPTTVPVEIQFQIPEYGSENNKENVIGLVEVPVIWKSVDDLKLAQGESKSISDAAMEVIVAADTQVDTQKGTYILPNDVSLNGIGTFDDIELVLNVVAEGTEPIGQLEEIVSLDKNQQELQLSLDLKPTGATSVQMYSYEEGDEEWTEIGDLLDIQGVNDNPKVPEYNSVTIAHENGGTYGRYCADEIEGFSIALVVEDGVYDGQEVTLVWPDTYTPHGEIPDIGGSGGGEVNVGTPDDEDGSGDGGQRPNLSSKPKPKPTPPRVEVDTNEDDTNKDDISEDDIVKSWENPYIDVQPNQYFYEGIAFVQNRSWMVGTTENTFSPYEKTTRGMLATVLARLAGIDTAGGEHWDKKGMIWAKSMGISDGSDPQGNLTREQMVTMLWRAADSPFTTQSLWKFSDSRDISPYAEMAMAWAYEQGIISGTSDTTLSPQSTVSRGEFATILMGYMQ